MLQQQVVANLESEDPKLEDLSKFVMAEIGGSDY